MSTPTELEISELPLQARVAFAARCARRVLPLFRYGRPDAPPEHAKALSHAIRVAEGVGLDVGSGGGDYAANAVARANVAAVNAVAHANASVDVGGDVRGAHAHAYAASSAADAARAAQKAYASVDADPALATSADAGALAYAASADAVAAAAAVGANANATVVAAINSDFGVLRKAAIEAQWSDHTPVPPEFFGPMWPNGPPQGWPELDEDTVKAPSASLDISSPPQINVIWDPALISPKEYADLITAIGDVVRAAGGIGVERKGSDHFGAKVGTGVLQ